MADQVDVRVHGEKSLPTIIYLPGLHGNWTLVGNFRQALRGRVGFAEISYPPSLTWSLQDYAAAVEDALRREGIQKGWLLAESFSSQVAWPLIERGHLQVEGLILAGGFVKYPIRWGVRLAERICGDISFSLLVRILFGYARVSRWRFRNSPETINGIDEFIARLTEIERQAAKHRLHLIAESDPCPVAQNIRIPMFALTGLFDPIVPWYLVRRWMKKNCPALRQFRVIWHADHNVLGTGAHAAADQVVHWIATVTASSPTR
jgi:pimeloyl-ACP methyl ester carboxylesterase